jgi:hypothetical protein
VTLQPFADDTNSYWLVHAAHGESCERGCVALSAMRVLVMNQGITNEPVLLMMIMAKTQRLTLTRHRAPVKCGSTVRLMHQNTKRNLHSHQFQSPLSGNQEVSAFGDHGEGDGGDDWRVECSTKHWQRNERVRLRHVATNKVHRPFCECCFSAHWCGSMRAVFALDWPAPVPAADPGPV